MIACSSNFFGIYFRGAQLKPPVRFHGRHGCTPNALGKCHLHFLLEVSFLQSISHMSLSLQCWLIKKNECGLLCTCRPARITVSSFYEQKSPILKCQTLGKQSHNFILHWSLLYRQDEWWYSYHIQIQKDAWLALDFTCGVRHEQITDYL